MCYRDIVAAVDQRLGDFRRYAGAQGDSLLFEGALAADDSDHVFIGQ